MKKQYLHKIDSLRGLAIILVLAFHTLACILPDYEANSYSDTGILKINLSSAILNFNPIAQGWIGVELFLVISGFLIHFIYVQNKENFQWLSFFSKRFWRIYPTYFLALLFFYIHRIDVNQAGLIDFFSHVFLMHNLNETTFFSINPSLWSIALEVQLYILYPIYISLRRYFNSLTIIVSALAILIILRLLVNVLEIKSIAIEANVFNFWFTWLSGAFLAEKFYANKQLFKKPIKWFIIFYLIFFVFKLFSFTNYFILIPATLSCVALLEVVLHSKEIDNFFLTKGLMKSLTPIGLISFSIYLIHQPYLNDLLTFFNPNTNNKLFNSLIRVAFSYITILSVAYTSYKLVEYRGIEYGKRLREKLAFRKS